MTPRCPTHNKPLVRTHGGSVICIPCYLAKCQEHRKAVASWTDPRKAAQEKGYYQKRKRKAAK